MLKWIHLHFIPSKENDHQPHFLRLKIVLELLFLMGLLQMAYLLGVMFIVPNSTNFAAIFATVLVDQTNSERSADSLGMLTTNPQLEVAAKLKVEDMVAKGYFSHNSPDGKTPWYWFEKVGYDYAAAGENLAVNFTDSKDVTQAWMRSPAHRANILSGNYTEIGIATAKGTYKGKSAIFVVQMFGRQSIVARQIDHASSTVASLTQMITSVTTSIPIKTPPPKVAGAPKPALSTASAQEKITTPTPVVDKTPIAQPLIPLKTAVAGADTQKLDVSETSFVETIAVVKPEEPTRIEELIASPRHAVTALYIALFAVLTLALSFAIFIKMHLQHRHIILNGLILLTAITLLIVLNAVLEFSRGAV